MACRRSTTTRALCYPASSDRLSHTMKRKQLPETITQENAGLHGKSGVFAVHFPSGFNPSFGVEWETYARDHQDEDRLVIGRGVRSVGLLGRDCHAA